jgi:NADH:ubiquinone oxidoreductase subunit 3 (subunit A)
VKRRGYGGGGGGGGGIHLGWSKTMIIQAVALEGGSATLKGHIKKSKTKYYYFILFFIYFKNNH